MRSFKLNSGRLILIDGVYIRPTYLTLDVGEPNPDFNKTVVKNVVSTARRIWPNCPIVVSGSTDVRELPKYSIAALLDSTTPAKDKTMHASQMVIVFFTDDSPTNSALFSIPQILDFAWEEHAEDFMY